MGVQYGDCLQVQVKLVSLSGMGLTVVVVEIVTGTVQPPGDELDQAVSV